MPVLRSIRERFAAERPLDGLRGRRLPARDGGDRRASSARSPPAAPRSRSCAANPLSTQDEVAAALRGRRLRDVRAAAARTPTPTPQGVVAVVDGAPQVTLDDGADLLAVLHAARPELLARPASAGRRRRRPASLRLRALEAEGGSRCPVIAVNEARTERALQRPLRHRPVDARRHPARDEPAARRARRRRARLRLDRPRRRAARPRRGRPGRSSARSTRCARSRRGWRASRSCRRSSPPSAATSSSPSPGSRDVLGARALRAHEGRRGARQRRPLRRRDRPRRAARDRGRAGRARCCPLVDAVRRSAAGG